MLYIACIQSAGENMHFNIYIDDAIGSQLSKLAKSEKKTRNALIREAIKEWVMHHSEKPKWPPDILAFNGIKSFPAFESQRKNLKPPKEDPLA